jgi:hypothetical protein
MGSRRASLRLTLRRNRIALAISISSLAVCMQSQESFPKTSCQTRLDHSQPRRPHNAAWLYILPSSQRPRFLSVPTFPANTTHQATPDTMLQSSTANTGRLDHGMLRLRNGPLMPSILSRWRASSAPISNRRLPDVRSHSWPGDP